MTITTLRAARPTGKRRGGHTSKNLLSVSTVAFAIVLALVGTGTTYALLNSAAAVEGTTISAGSTSLSVNGSTSATLKTDLRLLALGESTVAPVTITNTGTTPVSVVVSSTTIVSESRGLAGSLALRFEPAETCETSVAGTSAASIAGFVTLPQRLETGTSAAYCLEIFLTEHAPTSVQGGSAAFTLVLDANQVPR